MIYVDWMVGRLMKLMKDANLTSRLGSSGKDCVAEIILCNHLRATESEQNTTRFDMFKSLHVQSCISFQRIMKGTTMLCKCWRVEDYKVILISLSIKVFECIFTECLMTRIVREIKFTFAFVSSIALAEESTE